MRTSVPRRVCLTLSRRRFRTGDVEGAHAAPNLDLEPSSGIDAEIGALRSAATGSDSGLRR
jgi:hypothetical protein